MASSFSTQTQNLIAQAFADKDNAAAADAGLDAAKADLAKAQQNVSDAGQADAAAQQKASTSAHAALAAITAELGVTS